MVVVVLVVVVVGSDGGVGRGWHGGCDGGGSGGREGCVGGHLEPGANVAAAGAGVEVVAVRAVGEVGVKPAHEL